MLNYETLLSSYDDRLTLMQWLKKVEDALKDASAVSFDVVNYGNATLAFKIDFADGTSIESNKFVLQKGDSVESAAFVNGHLILTLTNGEEIDAGDLLGGNVNIGGNLDISGNVFARGDIYAQGDINAEGDLQAGAITAETLNQSSPNFSQTFTFVSATGIEITNIYNRCEIINNVLYLIANIKLKNISGAAKRIGGGWSEAGYIAVTLPTEIASKIYDILGNRVSDAAAPRTMITSVPVVCCEGAASSSALVTHEGFRFDFANLSGANSCAFYLENYPVHEIPVDGELYIMGRIALTLI